MSLNGNLESFPLEEVLRLLARSRKTGCLRVETEGLQGKVFVASGDVAFATTRGDEELRSDLLRAGLVRETDWPEVESRNQNVAQALATGVEPPTLSAFIKEQVVEALYRLRRAGHGSFEFIAELQPRYDTGQRLEVEMVVEESQRRMAQWAEIESVIPGMGFRLRMATTLPGDREITISPDTWRLLAALNGEGTVSGLAERLGSSEFQVARALAALVRAELLTVVDQVTSARYAYGEPMKEPGNARYGSSPVDFVKPAPAMGPYSPAAQARSEAKDDDDTLLASVFSELHKDPAAEPLDDAADRFAQEDGEEADPAKPKEPGPNVTIGLLRRRGLGVLRDLNDSNS